MPDNAEKKNISKLDFNINDALSNLDKIDKKLKTISESSEAYAKKIGDNLGKAINSGNLIDTASINKNLDKVSTLSKTKQEQLAVQTAKIQLKSQANQTEIVLKEEQKRQTAAYKSALKQEEYNNRVEKSTKTMYDKISEYAKTYVIYQGFNELRQSIKETIDEMVNVEYQMVQIDRVLSDSSLNIDKYRDKLIQMAYDYGNSFENVADITLRLAQAGFDAQESLMLTEKTLLALNTAELDATQATDDMVAVMAQWGLMTGTAGEQAESYGNIIDKINKVADNFPTTSEDILNALKKTSSAFNLAGASIDETIAMIVAAETASQRGGKVIGTALSNIVQQLKAEGKINIMESLGIDVYKDSAKQEFNNIIDIITQLSEKMQVLKDSGKENSAEMQNLLEVFTVFRRNVGASLLGEMAGEDSTYSEVLKTSIKSVGYSLQENEKHMQTAKAAQAQFNAELLKLKTEVWDAGLEDVFRSMLLLGTNLVDGISKLIDTFGLMPTTIGAAVLAYTALNKQMQAFTFDSDNNKIALNGFIKKIKEETEAVRKTNSAFKTMKDGQIALTAVQSKSSAGFIKNTVEVGKYGASLVLATAKTIALQVATVALNAVLSMGISLAITGIVTAINNLIHAEENAIKKQQEALESAKNLAEEYESENETIEDLIKQYDELAKKTTRTPEEENQIYEIQLKINDLISAQKEQVDLVNGSYEEQIKKLKEIYNEKIKQELDAKKKAKEEAESAKMGIATGSFTDIFNARLTTMENAGIDFSKMSEDLGLSGGINVFSAFGDLDWDKQFEYLTEWEQKLKEAGETGSKAYEWVSESLEQLNKQQEDVNIATNDYYDILAKQKADEWFSDDTIKSAEDFKNVMQIMEDTDFSNMEGFKEKVIAELINKFPEFNNEVELANGNLEYLDQTLKTHLTSLQSYADKYAQLKYAQDEYNTTGQLTIETLQGLINNDLLQYLTIQNGQLQINAQSMLNDAEAIKLKAIEELKDAAAMDIQKVATGDLGSISNIAKGAIAGVGNNAEVAGNQVQSSTSKMNNFAASIQNVINASKDKLGSGVDPNTFQKQASAIKDAYTGIAKTISSINISSASYSPKKASGGGGSSQAAANQAKREAEEAAKAAQKAEEEAYKARLKEFEGYIDEKERLEKRWVDKQKELGLLSNNDFMYITQQRIERYKKYLEELKKATWMNAEDRLRLEKEYSEKIEDLQVDYIGYLEDQLDDEIKALEDANKKKIELIEKEADARIAALDKVSEATDRAREEEEYKTERQTILDEISYWQQRTGREAQEALIEAKKKLEELDKAWKETQEDWTIEDEIKKIEEERDAEINAIEAAQEAEIKAMQDVYDAKVRMFAETGEIIYEGSVIQAQSLYNAYKTNFIDPISSELANLNQQATVAAPTPAPAEQIQQYETYLIKSGDTLSKIARRYGTTIEKIMSANPYVTNKHKIYAGKTLQIPKFHEGGIVGGNKEAFALLKPHEVILKPEWADGINKLAKMAKNSENPITNNSTTIEVKGDLVRIDANIKNKNDAEYLTRRVEKMLKDKFNIKK